MQSMSNVLFFIDCTCTRVYSCNVLTPRLPAFIFVYQMEINDIIILEKVLASLGTFKFYGLAITASSGFTCQEVTVTDVMMKNVVRNIHSLWSTWSSTMLPNWASQ